MRLLCSLACSLGLVVATAGTSSAGFLIGFDNIGELYPIPNGYQGFDWSNFGVIDPVANGLGPTGFASGYFNGIVSPTNVAYNGFGDPASFSSATPFTLTSAYLTAAFVDGLQVTVTGSLGGTQLFTRPC